MTLTRRSFLWRYRDPRRLAAHLRRSNRFQLRVIEGASVMIGLVLTVAACVPGAQPVSNSAWPTARSVGASIPAPPAHSTLVHLVPQPIPPDLQLVDPQSDPLDPIVLAVHRYAQLYTGSNDSLLYVDAQRSQPDNWAHPAAGPGESLVKLPTGPGILTAYSANADQDLFNRIGTVFNNRVPSPRAGGSILLWTDHTLDYYGVALNIAHGDQLLRATAAKVRTISIDRFNLSSPDPTLTLHFSGDPSQQWRSSQAPLSYGFVGNALGEVDIVIADTQPGFVEGFLGSATVTVDGHPAWLLASQPSFDTKSYTLFWHETPEEMVVVTSDGRVGKSDLFAFANSLRPIGDRSWSHLALQRSTS